MPAIPSPAELLGNILVHRNTDPISTNTTAPVLEVVCAWPVSGQYGPGTRVLYYALMVACVLARKEEWIRNSCLAAALLFPAVAAIHAIVLAAVHREGAVDMDVYGAFQLCAIGILTAPATVRLSKTYFNNPGRDIIFLWTGLLLAGLLSLTVEFVRLEPTRCPPDDPATIEWISTGKFLFTSNCGMICGDKGPFSPLRQYSANNIYVIPMPHQLTFSTATLLAAACCIPAILSLVSTWIKILEKNWEKIVRRDRQTENLDQQPIEGTNGATPVQMSGIAKRLRSWLTLIEIPVFAVAVLAILVKGEMNFFSEPVRYQTEPIASVGQWAPIVGTGLAAVGSLYLLLAAEMEAEEKGEAPPDEEPKNQPVGRCARCDQCAISSDNADSSTGSRRNSQSNDEQPSPGVERTVTQPSIPSTKRTMTNQSEKSHDPAGRRKVARFLNMASMRVAAKAGSQFEDSGFNPQGGEAFPEVPGEVFRNVNLPDIQKAYIHSPRARSRASSFVESIESDSSNGQGNSTTPWGLSRYLSLPDPARTPTRPKHSNTLPSRGSPSEFGSQHGIRILHGDPSTWPRSIPGGSTPDEEHVSRAPSITETSPTALTPGSQDTPKIVVSPD